MNTKIILSGKHKGMLFFLFCLLLIWPQQTASAYQDQNINSDLSHPLPKASHPKTESVLLQLLDVYMMQGLEKAEIFAIDHSIEMDKKGVRVVIETNTFGSFWRDLANEYSTKLLGQRLSNSGAEIEATFHNLIQTRAPLEVLMDFKDDALVGKIRLPLIPKTDTVSEGVSVVGAAEWQNISPYRTDKEVKVGIIDEGFSGYLSLLGTELPSTVETKSLRADGNLFASDHGTACAEIVYDIAPNAKLYLLNIGTDVEFYYAVEWLVSQEVDVVSCSISWVNAGAGDGTGIINSIVEWAYQNGIIWVNSAGNDADNHWMGNFNDPDSDGFHNFQGGDELFTFDITAGEWYGIFVNWDDWGTWSNFEYSGSDQDFDVYLYRWNGIGWDSVDFSTNVQSGSQWPVEQLSGYVWSSGRYGIAIHKENATKNVEFDIRFWGAVSNREYNVAEESMGIPADSPYVLAVGATSWQNDTYHYYSSRGPTKDGRIKPDLCAPSGISTVTYGSYQFYGTSPSAPLVAGACALLKEKTPFSQIQIMDTLEGRAFDLGEPGKDNLYGSGRLKLNK
jgi:hypothetical protein